MKILFLAIVIAAPVFAADCDLKANSSPTEVIATVSFEKCSIDQLELAKKKMLSMISYAAKSAGERKDFKAPTSMDTLALINLIGSSRATLSIIDKELFSRGILEKE